MPNHEIYAAIASIYLKGCSDVKRDAATASGYFEQAADAATEAMKGKMAAKYYEMAAEAEAQAEEDEEGNGSTEGEDDITMNE